MEEFESEFAAFQAEIAALAPEDDASADNKSVPLPPPPMPPPSHAPPSAAYDPYAAAYSAPPTAKPADPKKVQVVYGSAAVIERKPDGSAAAPPKKKAKKAPPGFDQKAKKRKKSTKAAAPTVALPPKMVEEKEKEKASKVVDAVVSKPPVLPEPPKEEPEPLFKTWTGVDPEAPSISDAGRKAVEANEKRVYLRKAAGKIWNDMSLSEWPDNDFRIFVGDLGNEVNDNTLAKVFVKYTSFAKAKVIRDKRTQKTKGYGFVSFLDPFDAVTALKEMQGCYVGNRPIKLRKSKWGDRTYVPKGKRKNHTY